MAIAFRWKCASAASGGNITLIPEDTPAPGDLMIAVITEQSGYAITPPAGWTLLTSIWCDPNTQAYVYTKDAGGSETTPYAFATTSVLNNGCGAIAAYSGSAGTPDNHSGWVYNGYDPATPSIDVTCTNSRVVAIIAANFLPIADPYDVPSGMTARTNRDPGGSAIGIFDVGQAAAGATGQKQSVGFSTLANYACITIALRPTAAISGASTGRLDGVAYLGSNLAASGSSTPRLDGVAYLGAPISAAGTAIGRLDGTARFGMALSIGGTASGRLDGTAAMQVNWKGVSGSASARLDGAADITLAGASRVIRLHYLTGGLA